METKRCQRCHKLLRAEAQTCSRCGGYDFLPASQAKLRPTGVLLADETHSTPPRTTRSFSPVGSPLSPLPPTQLSPHRAGHYSGLHPEDEPYQSSFLPVQRLPISEQPALDVEEVEDLTFSTVPDMPGAPAPAPAPVYVAAPSQKRRVASLTPLPPPRQQRSAQTLPAPVSPSHDTERDQEVVRPYVDAPTIPAPRSRRSGRRQPNLAVRLLLIIAAFLFVVATGILAFLLLDSRPTVALKPVLTADTVQHLRVSDTLLLYGSGFEASAKVTITRDAHLAVLVTTTYATGNFVAPITIGSDWSARSHTIYATDEQGHEAHLVIKVEPPSTAAPLLQVSPGHIDLGENSSDVVSNKSITLTNAGGGEVNWQGSSDSAWLKLKPGSGNFAGSEGVVITVDRSNLLPKAYTGHITFTLLDSAASALKLTVTMGVNPPAASPASANLVISNAAFTFSGDPVNNPGAQTIFIQNTGGQSLNWTASVSTTNGVNWLSLSSTSGYLAGGASSTMSVMAISAGLSVGTYAGTITFSYGGVMATPVTVALTVNPPPVAKIAISSGGLSFHTLMGQNPPTQSFTITNSGNAPLNWGILEDATAKTYTPVSQSSGALAAGKSAVISVIPSVGQAGAGTLNATITVVDTDAGTPVKSQTVKVTVTIVNQAIISLDQYQMSFNHSVSLQINVSTQMFMLTNTGSAPLNWSLTIANSSSVAWLSVDNSGGTAVPPGGTAFITVKCDSTNLSPGAFTATLTLRDTDAGTPVAPQTVTVTVVVAQ